MEHECTGDSPGPSTVAFVPSCSSTPVQVPAIPLVSTSQDREAGLMDSTDLELSVEDAHEVETVDDFITKGCGCQYGPGNTQCSSFLNKDVVEACRQDNMDLTRDELDLVVLAQIRAHPTDDKQPTLHASHHTTGDFRSQSLFFIKGVQVCRTTFLFLHCMSRMHYNNFVRHYEQ